MGSAAWLDLCVRLLIHKISCKCQDSWDGKLSSSRLVRYSQVHWPCCIDWWICRKVWKMCNKSMSAHFQPWRQWSIYPSVCWCESHGDYEMNNLYNHTCNFTPHLIKSSVDAGIYPQREVGFFWGVFLQHDSYHFLKKELTVLLTLCTISCT